jgi:predicted nucleic acid-binding protein
MDKVFVDTDIILDFLSIREPFYINAANLFSLADKGELQIFVSSLSFANLNYLLSKQYNTNEARKKLLKFKTLVSVLAVNEKTIELALASDFKDFEDGIQYFSAIDKGLKIILTRNLKDFKTADISVMTAEEYLKGIL